MAEDLAREDREFELLLAQGTIYYHLFFTYFVNIEEQQRQARMVEAEPLIAVTVMREEPIASPKVLPTIVPAPPCAIVEMSYAQVLKVITFYYD
jgi:hypothetical protein